MGIDGPTFVPKSGYFLLIRVKVCLKMSSFSYFLSQFYELAFLTKRLALSNKKSTFVLVSGFFTCCIFTILFTCYLKGSFLTKRSPQTTIITIFNAELCYFYRKIGSFGKFMWIKRKQQNSVFA